MLSNFYMIPRGEIKVREGGVKLLIFNNNFYLSTLVACLGGTREEWSVGGWLPCLFWLPWKKVVMCLINSLLIVLQKGKGERR